MPSVHSRFLIAHQNWAYERMIPQEDIIREMANLTPQQQEEVAKLLFRCWLEGMEGLPEDKVPYFLFQWIAHERRKKRFIKGLRKILDVIPRCDCDIPECADYNSDEEDGIESCAECEKSRYFYRKLHTPEATAMLERLWERFRRFSTMVPALMAMDRFELVPDLAREVAELLSTDRWYPSDEEVQRIREEVERLPTPPFNPEIPGARGPFQCYN